MAINPQINDMAWFGKPADPVDSFQKGMNLAEQSQRMKQSADMHPLKMADMKSATAARDANTNLSKQSYRFNELTEADRVSSVNSLARRNAVYANIAEKTEQAQVNMQNIQALEKARDWDIKKGVSISTAQRAAEAGLERIITEQEKNAATADSYIKRYQAETQGIQHRTSLLGLQTDLAQKTQQFRFNAVSQQLIQQAGDATRANKKHEEWMQGYPMYQAHVSRIEDASGRGDIAALRNMTFEGATAEQTAQLKSLVAQRLNNEAGREAEAAYGQRLAANTKSLADSFNLTDDQQEALENAGGIDPNTKALTTTGRKLVNRMKAQNDLLKDIPQEVRDSLLMQASDTTNPYELFQEESTERSPIMARGQSLAGKNAAIYGSKHGSEFILNERGMSRLRPLVDKYNKERAFADSNRKMQAQLTQIQSLGLRVKQAAIKDGKIELTAEAGRMTADQQQSAVRQMYETLAKAATDAGQEFTQSQLMGEARRQVFASTLPSASSAAELRGLGIRDGVPYWNPIAKNDDGTVGGVRIAGEPDVNTGHNALGPLKGANAGGQASTQPPAQTPTPTTGTTPKEALEYGGVDEKLWNSRYSESAGGGNRKNIESAGVIFDSLVQYTTPEHAGAIVKRAADATWGSGFKGRDFNPDKDDVVKLVEQVSDDSKKKLGNLYTKLQTAAINRGTSHGIILEGELERLNSMPPSQWLGTEVKFQSRRLLDGGGIKSYKLTAGNVAKLRTMLPEYMGLVSQQELNESLLRKLRYDASPPDESGRDSRYQSPSYADPKPKNNIKRLTEAEARKRFPELYQDDK